MAPALPQIASDLNMSTVAAQMAFSIYMLGLAFGPLVVAPLSETFGRRPVWLGCQMWYVLWASLCPVGDSRGAVMIVGRFGSGLGASGGIAVSFMAFLLSSFVF